MSLPPSQQQETIWKVVIDKAAFVKWGLITFFIGTGFAVAVTSVLETMPKIVAAAVCAATALGIYLFFSSIEHLLRRLIDTPPPEGEELLVISTSDSSTAPPTPQRSNSIAQSEAERHKLAEALKQLLHELQNRPVGQTMLPSTAARPKAKKAMRASRSPNG